MHTQQLWIRPHYQCFPLILVGAAILAWVRLKRAGSLSPGSRGWTYLLLAVDWALLVLAELLYSSWLATVAALILLAALAYGLGGRRGLRALLPAWVLLWLIVPPPFRLDDLLVRSLQTLTTAWSSAVLDLLGVFHVMEGNVVEVGGRRLLVEEACAGITSLLSVLACTLFFVLLARRPPLRASLLILAAVAWVLVANTARVVAVAWLSARWGINLADGWRHDALGMLLFALALVMIWSTDRLLVFLSRSRTGTASAIADLRETAPERTWPVIASEQPAGTLRRAAWPVCCAYGLIVLVHMSSIGWESKGESAAIDVIAPSLERLAAESLPPTVGPWKQASFMRETRSQASNFGEFSEVWTYQTGLVRAAVSLDHPFPDWHDLTICYTHQGWALGERTTGSGEDAMRDLVFFESEMSKPGYRYGQLWFCEFECGGMPLAPPSSSLSASLRRQTSALARWTNWIRGEDGGNRRDPMGPVYQVQLFVESPVPFNAEQRRDGRLLFLESVKSLIGLWKPAAEGVSRAD
jgi:exosortase